MLQLNSTGATCALPVDLGPGRYRVVVDGEGNGASADAAMVILGEERRRVAFGESGRQVFDVTIPKAIPSVILRAAEAGVIVDRIAVVRLGDAR